MSSRISKAEIVKGGRGGRGERMSGEDGRVDWRVAVGGEDGEVGEDRLEDEVVDSDA